MTLEELAAEVAELKTRIDHDEETRRQLLVATEQILPSIDRQQLKWNAAFEKILTSLKDSAAVGELRQEALLPHFNALKLQHQQLRLHCDGLADVVMESHSLVRQLFDLVKGNDDAGRH